MLILRRKLLCMSARKISVFRAVNANRRSLLFDDESKRVTWTCSEKINEVACQWSQAVCIDMPSWESQILFHGPTWNYNAFSPPTPYLIWLKNFFYFQETNRISVACIVEKLRRQWTAVAFKFSRGKSLLILRGTNIDVYEKLTQNNTKDSFAVVWSLIYFMANNIKIVCSCHTMNDNILHRRSNFPSNFRKNPKICSAVLQKKIIISCCKEITTWKFI